MTTVKDASLVVRSMDEPDERREPPLARIDVSAIGNTTIARGRPAGMEVVHQREADRGHRQL